MNVEVRLKGHGRIANRLADAVKAQDDLLLFPSSEQPLGDLNATGQSGTAEWNSRTEGPPRVLVDVGKSSVRIAEDLGGHRSYADKESSVFTALTTDSIRHGNGALLVPSPDSLSLARLVGAVQNLSPIERLYSTVVRRAAHAADDATSSMDALQPLFDETWLEDELASVLAGCVPLCQIRRVIASYTHSHLHMIKLDVVDSIDREVLVDTLNADSRILVGAADDGFLSTVDVQEFFRDHGRIRGDRWESFVWEESILVDDKCVYLMQDISPDAIGVPEVIDAIRMIALPQLSLAKIRQLSDQHLELIQTLNTMN